ncbi:MAG: DUF7931 domain-containing protein [Thiobacillus sp.]
MTAFETPAGLRAAFDALLRTTRRTLRVYDHDLAMFDVDDATRAAALRTFCVAGGGRRIELLADEVGRLVRDHPRLMLLLRDFGHVIEIRETDPDAPRPDRAFVLADAHGMLLRADKRSPHGALHTDDTARATELNQVFEALWQRAPRQVSATTLGL